MPITFENYTHSFRLKDKPIFVPSKLGERIGRDIKRQVERAVPFPDYYFHLRKGGHVAALHHHRPRQYFGKVDLKNFFYSIGRNRVSRSLQDVAIRRSGHYAKWSCVKSPFEHPPYALPLGFVQSPILASLVLLRSEAGACLNRLSQQLTCSVYVDDIAFSADSREAVDEAIATFSEAILKSELKLNEQKTAFATDRLSIFACNLEAKKSLVSPERLQAFFALPRTPASEEGFIAYCKSVAQGNA